MKVYRVVTERDGATTKEPGKTSTELLREEHRFAAETMQEVWDAIGWLRNDPERTLLAVIEEAPAMKVRRRPPRIKDREMSEQQEPKATSPDEGQSRSTGGLGADGIAFEYEACMRAMDVAGVPRTDPTSGAVYSILGRAQWMAANS